MAARKLSTTEVSKNEHKNFRDKARQFFDVMQACLRDHEWDAVFLSGVHAAISMTDALTVFRSGQRSTGQSHHDVSDLLEQTWQDAKDISQQCSRLGNILNWKHAAEYEPRRLTEKEARQFAQSVERYIEWAQKQLPLTS